MGKSELETWPIFNLFFKTGMNILVDRSNKLGAAKAFLKASKALDRGESIVIFPEATIPSDTPKLKEFKDGAFSLAIKKQVPIVPVTFTNNFNLLKSGGFFKSRALPGLAPVIVHPPIITTAMTPEDLISLREQCYYTIQHPLKPLYEN